MGGYRNEQDFNQLEIQGYQELYYGGGLATSEDGSIAILAGSTLGGGTVVNYMNCIPTPERIVAEWAGHGLAGLDDYDAYKRDHIDVVMERHQREHRGDDAERDPHAADGGAGRAGHEHRPIVRNASLDDDPEICGYCPMGCQQGCKRSAMKTWLQDASDAGARAVVGCHADRILVEDGARDGRRGHGDARGRLDHAR